LASSIGDESRVRTDEWRDLSIMVSFREFCSWNA